MVTAFDSHGALPARASPRGEPVDHPRSTRALADLALLSSRPTRNALHPTPLARLFFTDIALGRRLRLRNVVVIEFDSHGARPAHASPRGELVDGQWSTRVLAGLARFVFAANDRRSPPYAAGRGSSLPTPRQLGGCNFETSLPSCLTPVARDPRVVRPVENRPTAHGAHTRWRTWRSCLRCKRATRSTVLSLPTPCQVGGCGFGTSCLRHSTPVARDRRALCPVKNQPTAHGAHARAGGLGVVVFAANAQRAPPHAVD